MQWVVEITGQNGTRHLRDQTFNDFQIILIHDLEVSLRKN